MKVTFSNPKYSTAKHSIADVHKAMVEFLYNNGLSTKSHCEDFVKMLSSNQIGFNFKCANNNYSRALALLMILLTEDPKKVSGYISHDNDWEYIKRNMNGCSIYFNVSGGYADDPYKAVCDWIYQNMETKVTQ